MTDPIKLKLVTPLWTGDIEQKSNYPHETGILGSLRWWYEAILRAMGVPVHKGSSTIPCKFSPGEYDKPYEGSEPDHLYSAGLCAACQAYGATGYARRFRLTLSGGTPCFKGNSIRIIPPRSTDSPAQRRSGWFLGSGLVRNVSFKAIPLHSGYDQIAALLPLVLASRWGGLGARTQLGYGVVELPEDFHIIEADFDRWQNDELPHNNDSKASELPDLRQFFFAKVRFTATGAWWKNVRGINGKLEKDARIEAWVHGVDLKGDVNDKLPSSVPIAPAMKNWMRYSSPNRISAIAGVTTQEAAKWLYGSPKTDSSGQKSHINISCAYPLDDDNEWEFRVWGWLPEDTEGCDKQAFSNDLKMKLNNTSHMINPLGSLTNNFSVDEWKEFQSPRDPDNKDKNALEFIKDLIR